MLKASKEYLPVLEYKQHMEGKALFGNCFLEIFVRVIICKHIEHSCDVF